MSTFLTLAFLITSAKIDFFLAETENKSIEEILNEAKELINDTSAVGESAFVGARADKLYSGCSDSDLAAVNDRSIKDVNGNENKTDEMVELHLRTTKTVPELEHLKNGKYATST